MSSGSVHRYATEDDLAAEGAALLLERLLGLQAERADGVHVCLTGGDICNRVYAEFTQLAAGSDLDMGRIDVWWGDERFLPTDDPQRHAGRTLALLASGIPIASARIHPMPAADGIADADVSAAAYARELGDTVFDLCLLGVGADGHVASLFAGHPAFAERTHPVVGVNDSPVPPSPRITLTLPTLNRSREVWFVVSGEDKAGAVAASVPGNADVPAGAVRGTERTRWLLDRDAAADLPYHGCRF